MVDTVLLHTGRSEERAAKAAGALSDRSAITYAVKADQRRVGFGPQVVVVAVAPEDASASSDEERMLEVLSTSPGLRFILASPMASQHLRGRAGDCVVLAGEPDPEADADLIRAAIADAGAARAKGKKGKAARNAGAKRNLGPKLAPAQPAPRRARPAAPEPRPAAVAQPAQASAPAPKSAPAPAPKPAAAVASAPRPAPPLSAAMIDEAAVITAAAAPAAPPRAVEAASDVEAFDPSRARRARKMGYFIGVVLGALLAVGAALVITHMAAQHAQTRQHVTHQGP